MWRKSEILLVGIPVAIAFALVALAAYIQR